MATQFSKLSELTSLPATEEQTLLEALCEHTRQPLLDLMLPSLLDLFTTKAEAKDQYQALEMKDFDQIAAFDDHLAAFKQYQEHVVAELDKYVLMDDYFEEKQKMYERFATKFDLRNIQEQFNNLPKLDQCMVEIYHLQTQINKSNAEIERNCVSRDEFKREINATKTWV